MKNKAIASVLSALIVVVLLLAGPAQGFVLNLSLNNSNPTEGEKITFFASLEIEAGEQLPVDFLTLDITGPRSVSCLFNPDGSKISGCDGIKISLDESPSFGYGYGYGYYGYGYNFGYGYGYQSGKLVYRIVLDTSGYASGIYATELKAEIGGKEFSQKGEKFIVKSKQSFGSSNDGESESGGLACRTEWQCTEWSVCVDGAQTRTCTKEVNRCYAGPIPEEARSCEVGVDFLSGSNDEGALELNEDVNKTEEFVSRVTGAVTGAFGSLNSGNVILIAIVIALIVLALAVVVIVRARGYSRISRAPVGRYY